MPCFHPIQAFQPFAGGPILFVERGDWRKITIPCRRCVGCRLEHSRQWAVRCMHEASLHKRNCFITLTYSDECVPRDMSLDYRHFQLFMKRLRKALGPVRFYMCGEYGETFSRPHYHALFFGLDFDDKYKVAGGSKSAELYMSPTLDKLWGCGKCWIGAVTFESAAYVSRYIMKKVTGDAADGHYTAVDLETGELVFRTPEFAVMSRRPGIGAGWFAKFRSDVYPHDYVVVRGKKSKPPRYYDVLLGRHDEYDLDDVKAKRALDARLAMADNSIARLADKEKCADARVSQFKRKLR